jgi:nucleoside-diphosphate-sugar epimerase
VRAVVTGAQGLLGRQVVSTLLGNGAEAVLGVGRSPQHDDFYTHDLAWLDDRLQAPVPKTLRDAIADERYTYRSLDLRDQVGVAKVGEQFAPDLVIHTAAALRDASWQDLFDSNLQATLGVINGFAMKTKPRFVLVSSGSIYGGGRGAVPFQETGPTEPIDPYGATKRAGEDIARITAGRCDVLLTQARVFNLVGAGLQDRHLPAVLAGRVAAICRGFAPPVLRLGPLTATRDFVAVEDAADALLAIANTPGPPPVINVASGVEIRVSQMVTTLLDIAGRPDVTIETIEGRPTDIPRAFADIGLLKSIGFSPTRSLTSSLSEMLNYFDGFPGRR